MSARRLPKEKRGQRIPESKVVDDDPRDLEDVTNQSQILSGKRKHSEPQRYETGIFPPTRVYSEDFYFTGEALAGTSRRWSRGADCV